MTIRTHPLLQTLLRVLGLCACAVGALPAAELASAFPKEPPPLTLEARLGRPFGDHAVFQQQMPLPVWGWTLPGAQVRVSFDDQQRSTTAGSDGRWDVTFDPLPADRLKSPDAP